MAVDFLALLTFKKLALDFVLVSQEDYPQLYEKVIK